jgi:uncharacterized protein YcfJ
MPQQRLKVSSIMNRQLLIGGILGALAITTVAAVAGYRALDPKDYADVVAVKAAMKTVSTPREECRDELVTLTRETNDPHQVGGTVIGAVVGGVIGNQIGGGSGKKIATAGGAIAGGVAGNKIQEGMQERNTYQETRRVCVTVNDTRKEPAGFDVTYRLEGKEHSVRTDYDPGKRIVVENGTPVVSR